MTIKSRAAAAAIAARTEQAQVVPEPHPMQEGLEEYRDDRYAQLAEWFAEIGVDEPANLRLHAGIVLDEPRDRYVANATWQLEGYRYKAEFVNGWMLYVYVWIPDGARTGEWHVARTLAELGESLALDCRATRVEARRKRRKKRWA
jgi:hypothetical protein